MSPYSQMTDPRVHWGKKYVTIHHNPGYEPEFRMGTNNALNWAAYVHQDVVLVKRYVHELKAIYPDGGASFETYCNSRYLEMETLSPVYRIEPGGNHQACGKPDSLSRKHHSTSYRSEFTGSVYLYLTIMKKARRNFFPSGFLFFNFQLAPFNRCDLINPALVTAAFKLGVQENFGEFHRLFFRNYPCRPYTKYWNHYASGLPRRKKHP